MSDVSYKDVLEGVAVIGMSGRFPGAGNIDQFWENLKSGVESISFFSKEDARACGIDEESINDPNYVFAGGILEDIDMFDAGFFGLNPREAENMDPQQRLFLECSYEALENAGYSRNKYDYPIGVYAGSNMSYYFLYHLLDKLGVKDDLSIAVGNDKDYMATRTSYQFNLKGPSINIQTACSTSMTAIAMAYEGLLNYHCDMAIAGGAGIKLPQKAGYLFQTGFIGSPDGHTRPFDEKAYGTVFTSAVGVVLLKRLEDAVKDGDHIYAVIKGIAVNNDGSDKIGFTAPSREGQSEVIAAAQNLAGVYPEDISYIETHGTGTSLGDPIEISALTNVFKDSTDKKAFCAIGSVKSNIGHAISGAGVASMIKTVLALKHKQIPPSINFETPNPKIDFENSAFYVNTRLKDWKSSGKPRLAGVSSFGFGGTNVHAILEEAPVLESSKASRSWQLVTLSAKTEEALDKMCLNLAGFLRNNPFVNFPDVVYTLHVGRKEFEYRRAILCRDINDAIKLLELKQGKDIISGISENNEAYNTEASKLIEDIYDTNEALTELAKLWVKGALVDWNEFHKNEKRLRVPLPTYPFERKRYWINQYNMSDYVKKSKKPVVKSSDYNDWLYYLSWKRAVPVPFNINNLHKDKHWLIFMDDAGIGVKIEKYLKVYGIKAVTVHKGQELLRTDEFNYTINPGIEEHYDALIRDLSKENKKPGVIVHLWCVTGDERISDRLEFSKRFQVLGFYSLLFLSKALSGWIIEENIRLSVVSNNMHSISGERALYPEKAVLLGCTKVIPMEYNNISCKSIDIVLPEPDSKEEDNLVKLILSELALKDSDFVVAIRDQYRWVQTIENIKLLNNETSDWLRDGTTCLITGGLGGIGLALAEYMARKAKVRLVLTGRSSFPEREQWEWWLNTHDKEDKTSEKIKKLLLIEELGSQMMVESCDVSDKGQMMELIKKVNTRFGELNGVVHTAGISDNGLIQEKCMESAAKVLLPKVQGTLVLDEILSDKKLEFMVLFSSSSSILGEAGFVDYCGANAFLDAYAYYKTPGSHTYKVSIDWDEWGDVGMAVNTNSRSQREKITADEGLKLLDNILSLRSLEQVVVAPGDFIKRLNDIEDFRSASLARQPQTDKVETDINNRPDMSTPYVPPQNNTQKIITELWQKHLGIYPVGIDDDFFELGGHSLLATVMISELRMKFRKNVSLQSFLESSTVANLAGMLDKDPADKEESDDSEDGYIEGEI